LPERWRRMPMSSAHHWIFPRAPGHVERRHDKTALATIIIRKRVRSPISPRQAKASQACRSIGSGLHDQARSARRPCASGAPRSPRRRFRRGPTRTDHRSRCGRSAPVGRDGFVVMAGASRPAHRQAASGSMPSTTPRTSPCLCNRGRVTNLCNGARSSCGSTDRGPVSERFHRPVAERREELDMKQAGSSRSRSSRSPWSRTLRTEAVRRGRDPLYFTTLNIS